MKNLDYLRYTYRHRQALVYTINHLIHDPDDHAALLDRAQIHDMDKMILYLFMEKKEASRFHRLYARHHLTNRIAKTRIDLLEAIMDFECAAYTKADKPLNAYDTIQKLHEIGDITDEDYQKLMPMLEQYGMARSYSVRDDEDGMRALTKLPEPTEEDILKDILRYVASGRTEKYLRLF